MKASPVERGGGLGGLQLRPVRRRRRSRRGWPASSARRSRPRAVLGRRRRRRAGRRVLLAAPVAGSPPHRRRAGGTAPTHPRSAPRGRGRHGRRRLTGAVRPPRLALVLEQHHGHPLRHPPQGGRVAAGHRRGGRLRHLRAEVPRRRPGPQGAGRRGHRRRAGPARSGSRARRLAVVDLQAPIAKLRGGRGGPGPAHREPRPQPRHRLPARLVRLRRLPATAPRRGRRHPVAGRAHRQRRPHVEQPQPAGLAPRTVVHRPRRRALLPPQLAEPRRRPRAVRRAAVRRQHPRAAGRRRRTCAAAHERLAPLVTAELLDEVTDPGARRVARAGTRPGLPRRRPRGIREHLLARVANPAALAPGRTRHEPATATSTSCCAASRAWSARSSSTSGSCSTASGATSSRPRYGVDEARLRALAPDLDLEEVRDALETVCQVCRGVTGGGLPDLGGQGRRFGWLSAPRSTVVQPGPVHGGLTADPAAELEGLLARLVARPASH